MGKRGGALLGAWAIASCVGVFLGPASWYFSHSFYAELHDLEARGTTALATVDATHESIQFRYADHSADIHFNDAARGELVRIEGVEINALYEDVLRVDDQVEIWYAGDRAVIVDNYRSQYVPLIKRRYWGMVLTILSLGFFVRMVVILQRKKRVLKQNR